MDFQQRIVVPDDVLFQTLEDEVVIINLNDESYYSLDDIGTRVWEGLQNSENIAAVYESLLAEFDVSPEQLKHDLINLIQGLLDAGLISLEQPEG